MKTAVFDLDGTLYQGSTLKKYFIFGVKKMIAKGQYIKAVNILINSLLVKLRLRSHIDVKYKVCKLLSRELSRNDYKVFAQQLRLRVDKRVMDLVRKSKEEGYFTVMSTASPEEYCEPFGLMLGLDKVLATRLTPTVGEYKENRGEEKVMTLRESGLEDTILVVTDHYDDLPLLKENEGKNILVNPSRKTLQIMYENKVSYSILSD